MTESLEDPRIRALEAENALFKIVIAHLYNDLTAGTGVTQKSFDMLKKATEDMSGPVNHLFAELKALHDLARISKEISDLHLIENAKRSQQFSHLRAALKAVVSGQVE
jgi:hypothetical protein